MGHDRAPEALRRRGHIAQAIGVGHEIAKARREMAVNRVRRGRRAPQARGRSVRRGRQSAQWRARAVPLPRQAAAATAGRAPRSQRRESNRRASKLRLGIRQRGSLRITCRSANHDRMRLDSEGFRAGRESRRPQALRAESRPMAQRRPTAAGFASLTITALARRATLPARAIATRCGHIASPGRSASPRQRRAASCPNAYGPLP